MIRSRRRGTWLLLGTLIPLSAALGGCAGSERKDEPPRADDGAPRAATTSEVADATRAAAPEATPPPVPDTPIGKAAFLRGEWWSPAANGRGGVEERWSSARGGSMLGTNRMFAGERLAQFEFLRIVERGEELTYVAQPGGGKATRFPLARAEPGLLVFENPEHDFPKRIVYRLDGDVLTARVDGGEGSRQAMEWTFRRQAP
ncbi:MAG TPA: DUF6265 family protein [Planctomycetota bacterium]|nr:DUF6265 family protein [Planctomycetota bacterium]